MAFPQGINFRSTLGFVTDGANEWAELVPGGAGAPDYPATTTQGNTVGWEFANGGSNISTRDREALIDRRLAGTNFDNIGLVATFRVDLPSVGAYNIRLAAGDADNPQPVGWDLYDGVTFVQHLTTGSTSAADKFKDATNTEYSSAAWPGSNTAISVTFVSSSQLFRLNSLGGGTGQPIAHLYVEAGTAILTDGFVYHPAVIRYPDTVMIL